MIHKTSNISAMILAAGRGSRMKNFTDKSPKPLMLVKNETLIELQIKKLVNCGITNIVINVAYLSENIISKVGFGDKWNINIQYSIESSGALGVSSGIIQALPLLTDNFILVNADAYSDFDFQNLINYSNKTKDSYLVLTDNPEHNIKGDFFINGKNGIINKSDIKLTYTGIAMYHKSFFYTNNNLKSINHLWNKSIENKSLKYIKHSSVWIDVGTPERLKIANEI